MAVSSPPSDKHVDRLLRHLATAGGQARRDPLAPDKVLLLAVRGATTLGCGTIPAPAADAAEAAGLARWRGEGSAARLTATPEARAHLARAAAPAGIDPFRAQHGAPSRRIERLEGEARPMIRDEAESPLAWLRGRRGRDGEPLLDAAAFEAGERLRRDMTMAAMLPRVTVDWSRFGGAGGGGGGGALATLSASEATVAARARVERALSAVGPDMADLLVDVCGFLRGLGEIETARGWPRRSAKVVLDLALARLAAHYGLAAVARGPARARGTLAWGTPDYRPRLDAAESER